VRALARTLACAVLLALAAAGASAQSADLIRVGTGPDDQAAPLIYAAKYGIYKKYGLNVDVQRLAGAATVAAALAGGSLEVGKASTMGAVTAIAKGLPFTIIANLGYYDAAEPDFAFLVGASSPIRTPKDLEGKTFGAVSLLDMNSVATFSWLDRNGVDRSTIKYAELPASATLAAIEQNRIVGATVYEPYLSAFLATGKVRVLGHPYDAIGRRFSDAVLFANAGWVAEHRDAVARFLRAVQESSTYIAAHENLSVQLIAEFGGLDPASIPNVPHAHRGVALSPGDIQPLIDAAAKYSVIPRSIPAQEMICSCALLKK
jgi:NitT/TauT family transport system substrate-binding protein